MKRGMLIEHGLGDASLATLPLAGDGHAHGNDSVHVNAVPLGALGSVELLAAQNAALSVLMQLLAHDAVADSVTSSSHEGGQSDGFKFKLSILPKLSKLKSSIHFNFSSGAGILPSFWFGGAQSMHGNDAERADGGDALIPGSSSSNSNNGVFGVRLELLDLVPEGPRRVPVVFKELLEGIRVRGLGKEGLFRVAGNAKKVKELRDLLNSREKNTADTTSFRALEYADVLKQFLRMLPEPVVPEKFTIILVEVAKFMHRAKSLPPATFGFCRPDMTCLEEAFYVMQLFLLLLPQPNRDILESLLVFCGDVVKFSEQNKMTSANLAKVFTPNLLQLDEDDPQTPEHLFLLIDLVTTAIDRSAEAFLVPKSVAGQKAIFASRPAPALSASSTTTTAAAAITAVSAATTTTTESTGNGGDDAKSPDADREQKRQRSRSKVFRSASGTLRSISGTIRGAMHNSSSNNNNRNNENLAPIVENANATTANASGINGAATAMEVETTPLRTFKRMKMDLPAAAAGPATTPSSLKRRPNHKRTATMHHNQQQQHRRHILQSRATADSGFTGADAVGAHPSSPYIMSYSEIVQFSFD